MDDTGWIVLYFFTCLIYDKPAMTSLYAVLRKEVRVITMYLWKCLWIFRLYGRNQVKESTFFFFFFFPREFPYTIWEGINTFELVLFRIMLVMSLSWLLIISQLILMILYCCNQLINLVKILIWFEAIGSCLSCLFNLEIE